VTFCDYKNVIEYENSRTVILIPCGIEMRNYLMCFNCFLLCYILMVLYFNFQRLNKSIFFKCYKLRSQFNPLSAKKHLYVHLFKFVIFSSRFEKEIAGNLPPPPKMPEMMNPPNFMGGPPSMPGPPPFMNRQGDGGSQQRMAFPGPPPQMPSNMFGPPRMDGMQRPPGMPPGMPAPPPMMVPPPMMPMPPMGMPYESF